MRPDPADEYVTVESAGSVAGISPRTLRYWIANGKLPAIEGQRGKLVNLADVRALAALTGKLTAATRQPDGDAGNPATSAGPPAGNLAGNEDEPDNGVAVAPAAITQLEAIRDRWLQPLIDQIRELERDRGRLEAERNAAVAGKSAAERTIAELRAEVTLLREIREARHTEDDTDRFTPVPSVWEPQETSRTAPGREEAATTGDEASHRESWFSSALRRLLGRA